MLKRNNTDYSVESLQKIIDEQNREISKLHWASSHIEEYEAKQEKLNKLINEHNKLCIEARLQLKKYIELNKELSLRIAECKKEIDKIRNQS